MGTVEKKYISAKEASDLLKCKPESLKFWEKAGLIKSSRSKHDKAYLRSDIESFLNMNLSKNLANIDAGFTTFLDNIYSASLKLLATHEKNKLYETIVSEANNLLETNYGSILLARYGKLVRVFSTSKQIANSKVRQNGRNRKVLESKEPLVSYVKDENDLNKKQLRLGIKTIIFIPLTYDGMRMGVLNLFDKEVRTFSEQEMCTIKLFGSFISLAIRNNQIMDYYKEEAKVTELFMTLASHELRNPLSTAKALTQLINKRALKNAAPDKDWTVKLDKEMQKISNIIKGLLDVSVIKKQKIEIYPQRVTVKKLVEDLKDTFVKHYPERNLVVEKGFQDSQLINLDLPLIVQAISNIFDNAVKFSVESESVKFEAKTKKNFLLIKITDKGRGIPKKEIDNIFKPYYKSMKNEKSGLGVGLFLAKNIIEKHGGIITIQSKENLGTKVNVKLPLYDKRDSSQSTKIFI